MHQEHFTVYQKPFTLKTRYIYIYTYISHQKLSTLIIAPNSFCTETFVKNYLHQKVFAPEALHQISFRGQAVYTRSVCTQNRCTSNNNQQPLRETTRILLHKKQAHMKPAQKWNPVFTSHPTKKKTPPREAIISSHLFKVNFVLWGFVVMYLRSSKGWSSFCCRSWSSSTWGSSHGSSSDGWCLMNVFHLRILCCAFGKKNIPRLQCSNLAWSLCSVTKPPKIP